MARRKRPETDIPASALQFDVVEPADAEAGDAAATAMYDFAVSGVVAAVSEAADVPEAAPAPAPEHKDIGQWEATYWKGRPIWRHRRTKTTLHKRDAVWKQRNVK